MLQRPILTSHWLAQSRLAWWCIASSCITALVTVVTATHSHLPLVGAVRVGLVVHSQQLPTHQLEIAGRIVAQLRQQLKGSSPRLVPGTSAAATARRRSCSPCHSWVDYRNTEITQHALKDRVNARGFQSHYKLVCARLYSVHGTCTKVAALSPGNSQATTSSLEVHHFSEYSQAPLSKSYSHSFTVIRKQSATSLLEGRK